MTADAVVDAIRRRPELFVVIGLVAFILVNAIGFTRAGGGPLYHAEALIVATELEIRIESLPRTAAAIFDGGTVASTTADAVGGDIAAADLIPSVITVEPVENTLVIEVGGSHPDPELAARYANVAAQALVDELNRVGPSLGTFQVLIEAPAPTEPVGESFVRIFALSVLAAGLVVAGTAILYTFFARRSSATPLAQDGDAAGATDLAGDVDEYQEWSLQDAVD